MEGVGGIRHVRVTAGLRQNLHLVINAAPESARRVRQRKVPVHKDVLRLALAIFVGQTSMLVRQRVTKRNQLLSCAPGAGGLGHTVVQMDLDLTPAVMAETRQLLNSARSYCS